MSMKYINRFVAVSTLAATTLASAAVNPQQGTWTTTLQGRDLNDDGIADAFYDTDLKISWLADVMYARTSDYPGWQRPPEDPLPGIVLDAAKEWAAQLDIHGIKGWRLPKTNAALAFPNDSCNARDLSAARVCQDDSPLPSSSEMAHMFSVTLGGALNAGPFTNFEGGTFWSATSVRNFAPISFDMDTGTQYAEIVNAYSFNAWAVHIGDVGVIPEPGTYALLIAGIAALGLHRRYGSKPN